eukprot:5272836-Amphidinium_carterae.3
MESLLRNTCCSTVHRTDNKCCTERRRADCLEAAKEADDMLVQALDRLCALSLEENALYSLEFSIVDNLRRSVDKIQVSVVCTKHMVIGA